MTTTIGLERLPRPIATPLDEAAAKLPAIANELDAPFAEILPFARRG